jgi:glycosyltransferase 2 family protein
VGVLQAMQPSTRLAAEDAGGEGATIAQPASWRSALFEALLAGSGGLANVSAVIRDSRVVRFTGVLSGVAVTCVFGYFAVRDVDLDRFRNGLAESNYAWLIPALGVLAAAVWLRAVRWQLLFTPETRPPLAAVTSSLLIGYFFNQLLPARAGEAARVLALHRASGTSRAEAAGTAVTERIFDVLSLLALLFVAVPFMPDVAWVNRAVIFAAVFSVMLGALILAVFRYGERPVSFLLRPLVRLPGVSRERVDAAAVNVLQGLVALHRPRLALPALVVTVASWLVLAVSFWCVLVAYDLGLGYDAALLAVIAADLVLVVPSAPAAVGTFEAAVVLALTSYGVVNSDAFAVAVVLHAVNLFPFLVCGAWALNHHTVTVRRRTRARAAS